MKIICHCGQTIFDSTDDLPDKAHFIPDQEWFNVLDRIDAEVIDGIADGTLPQYAAYTKARAIIGRSTRLIWQCRSCGRVYINDRHGKLHCYLPETDETAREILRSRGGDEPNYHST